MIREKKQQTKYMIFFSLRFEIQLNFYQYKSWQSTEFE